MVLGVVTAVIFLVTKNLFTLLTIGPLYAIARILIVRDPAIFGIDWGKACVTAFGWDRVPTGGG